MMPELGRALWAELHALPGRYRGELNLRQRAEVQAWLAEFSGRVAEASALSGGCFCAPEWAALTSAHPPALETADTLWGWTVSMHNHVNRRLGKPVWRGGQHRCNSCAACEQG